MDVEVENNSREIASESGIGKPSSNGVQRSKENGIEVVDLTTDIPNAYNGDLAPKLSDFVPHPSDTRFLSKDDLLKSLSDIDKIVINNSSPKFPSDDMLMQYISKSAAFQTVSDNSKSNLKTSFNQDDGTKNISNSSKASRETETENNR